ncbi:MAG: hypothetical protein WDN00_07625 [Limisphaerales bacterium]
MNEPSESPRRYRWPWFAAAAVVLFVVLTVVWMSIAVKRQREQSDFSAPLPSSSPAH